MGKSSKPWLNYKSDAPEREYFEAPRKKRQFKWALFWLIVGGHWGAHRLYLWDGKKAIVILILFLASFVVFSIILVRWFELTEGTAVEIAPFIPWLLIVFFELPRLNARVGFKNKKYLIL